MHTWTTWRKSLSFPRPRASYGDGNSTNASAQFDVYNPLNNCGATASMAHDWQLHVVEVSINGCLVPGGGVQAVRVDPFVQGLALHKMRLTIKDAVF